MTLRSLTSLVVVMALAASLHADQGADQAARLQAGIKQVEEGNFGAALTALESLIHEPGVAGGQTRTLSKAQLYRGIALVGLAREDAAKAAFREALRLDPELRLAKEEFPDRVIRVFEAARTGKAKSVLERPTTTTRKAGIGALRIAAIVGGGALVGGGVAAAAGGGSPSTTVLVSTTTTTIQVGGGANRPPAAVFRVTPDPPRGEAPLRVTFNMCPTTDPDNDACSSASSSATAGGTRIQGRRASWTTAMGQGISPPARASPTARPGMSSAAASKSPPPGR